MNKTVKNIIAFIIMVTLFSLAGRVSSFIDYKWLAKGDYENYNFIVKQINEQGEDVTLKLVGNSQFSISSGKNTSHYDVPLYMDDYYRVYVMDTFVERDEDGNFSPTIEVKQYQDKVLLDSLHPQSNREDLEYSTYDNLKNDMNFYYFYQTIKRYYVYTDINQIENYNMDENNEFLEKVIINAEWIDDYVVGAEMSYE